MKKLYVIILLSILCCAANAQVCLKPTTYSPGSSYIATADFNNDGKSDLAFNYADSVRTMFGDGLGGFTLGHVTITHFSSWIGEMACADYNKDGNMDVAFPYGLNYVVTMLGNGAGSFGTISLLTVLNNPWAIISNDYNGDGNPDIAVGNGGSNKVSVLLGDGTGNFTAHVDSVGADMAGMADGDFNGDGKPDLAVGFNVGNGMGGKIAIMLNNGSGNFSAPTNFVNGGYDPYDLTVGDFNGDGKLDVVTSTGNSDAITLLLGDGVGNLGSATSFTLGLECTDILNADFNSDGKKDVALADVNSNFVSVLLGTGTGGFNSAINYPDIYVPQTIVSSDFNGDGKPDLAAGNQQGGNMMVFLNVAAPNLNLISSNPPSLCSGASATLTVSGATTYTWSTNTGVLGPRDSINPIDSSIIHLPGNYTVTQVAVTPSVNSTYSVVAQTNGCKDSASVSFTLVKPQIPSICMVSTDSASNYNYNIIYWNNTYPNVDSFIIRRYDPVSNSYLRIGAVSKDSLSEFKDTAFSIGGPNGGNPQYGSWQYKLAIKDTCGNISALSPYHQTAFIQENSSNFSWNDYVDSSFSTPPTGYSFLRDDNNTGAWHVLANLGHTATSTTDPNYASYPNGNWRIDALGFSCTPTYRLAGGNNGTNSALAKSHSNPTKQTTSVGIKQLSVNNSQVSVYPNPNNGSFIIETNTTEKQTIALYDVNGKLVLSQNLNSKTSIDASGLNEGVYNLSIVSSEGVINKRLVIVK